MHTSGETRAEIRIRVLRIIVVHIEAVIVEVAEIDELTVGIA